MLKRNENSEASSIGMLDTANKISGRKMPYSDTRGVNGSNIKLLTKAIKQCKNATIVHYKVIFAFPF